MSQREALKDLISGFDQENLVNFFRKAHEDFKPATETFPEYVAEEPDFLETVQKVGDIEYDHDERLQVFRAQTTDDITKRTSKKRQYDLAKKILKSEFSDAGIFVFHDDRGHFRFSLVVTHFEGTSRTFTPFRRYTYYVSPEKANKTFVNQVGKADFSNLDSILKAFSIDAVSDDFYDEFKPKFQAIADATKGTDVDQELKEDFALLFAIRVIFLGFVQKKGWLGDGEEFLTKYWDEYKKGDFNNDTFYDKWLKPLFFNALNSQPGTHVSRQTGFSDDTREALQMAPYLNGNLFKEKPGYDDIGLWIPDDEIELFFEFLFRHNLTVEENTYYDQELELNPEFLGIIFEKMVNKEDGAIYTPRTEVDFMCRMGLVKWLQKNSSANTRDLYRLFFRERGRGDSYDEYQKQGDFSPNEISELVEKLENVTVCDPAAGSGAFEVGMLHVLQEVLENLYNRSNAPDGITSKSGYELKKSIIARSLYGVEVKQWAVWINHLRLWLTLFIDMPDDEKMSMKPLLPSLNFKVRCGDSLVQRIGSKLFPVQGHADLSSKMKRKVTKLKNTKTAYFNNKGVGEEEVTHQEFTLFRDIIREELDEKRQKLNRMEQQEKKAAHTQQGSLGAEFRDPSSDQQDLEFNKEDKDKLKQEIVELEEQENNLAEDHPLIWNIEFADIFVEKGGFDVIIGNPPYVQREDIADPKGGLSSEVYKKKLDEMVRLDFPSHFKRGIEINGRSDLYTYFYVRSLKLLNKSGSHIFICSNSWLDAGYGSWLQYFLLRNLEINYVIDNHAKRSFANADVNTIITLFSAPNSTANKISNKARFVAFKRPFEEVILTENLQDIEDSQATVANNKYRAFPISQQRLLEAGSEFENPEDRKMGQGVYVGDKWGGKYLRAPDIFFKVIDKGKKHLGRLNEYFEGERYLNTGGADGFFITKQFEVDGNQISVYNDNTNVESISPYSGKIKKNFFKPLIKDIAKEKRKIAIDDYDAICFVVEDDLTTNAKEYIKWGEDNNYNERSGVKNRKPWYKPTRQMLQGASVLVPRSFHDTFIIHQNPDRLISLRFYRFHLKQGDLDQLVAYLNSTLFWFFFEVLGNKNQGQGVLGFYMRDSLQMDIPIVLSSSLIEPFNKIRERKIESIFKECGINPDSEIPILEQEPTPKSDREKLDEIIFNEVGINGEDRKEIYRSICQLVAERLDRANSV